MFFVIGGVGFGGTGGSGTGTGFGGGDNGIFVVLGQAVVVVWEDQPEDQPWLDSGTQPFVQQKRGILVPAGPFVLARLVSDHTRGETPQWLQQLWLHHQ